MDEGRAALSIRPTRPSLTAFVGGRSVARVLGTTPHVDGDRAACLHEREPALRERLRTAAGAGGERLARRPALRIRVTLRDLIRAGCLQARIAARLGGSAS